MSPSGHSCLPLLAAWPLAPACRSLGEGGSTAGGRVTRAPGTATSPRKTRVGGVLVPPSGRSSRRRRTAHGTATGCRLRAARTVLGRSEWPNRDPIGEKGGLNLYAFAGNAPVVLFDGLGRSIGDLADAFLRGAKCVVGLWPCRKMIQDQLWAVNDWANSNFGAPGHWHSNPGSVPDMLTHCVGACEVAKRESVCLSTGIDARGYLQWRELKGVIWPEETPQDIDSEIDILNNGVGFQVADERQDCKTGCLNALANTGLWTLTKGEPALYRPPPPPPAPIKIISVPQ